MSKKDYYKILGINQSANKQDIRSAYFKLTKKYHPNRNISKNEAEKKENTQKFQDINEAYSILYDDQKRDAYDRGIDPNNNYSNTESGFDFSDFGFTNANRHHSSNSFDFSDFFDMFSGGSRKKRRNAQSAKEDLRVTLDQYVTLEDIYNQKTINIQYTRNIQCQQCSGIGATKKCMVCNGQGVRQNIRGIFVSVSTCEACNGQGREICNNCNGKGIQMQEQHFSVKIPKYLTNDKPIKIEKMGNYGYDGYGDLYISIRIKEHELFKYCNTGDLSIIVPITIRQSIEGGIIKIPTIKKQLIEVQIQPNTQSNDEILISKYGMQSYSELTKDLIVEIYVETPKLSKSEAQNQINIWDVDIKKYKKVSEFNIKIQKYINS